MKNILNQYLNKKENFEETSLPQTKKKVKKTEDLVEVVDKVLIIEDGRQILNG